MKMKPQITKQPLHNQIILKPLLPKIILPKRIISTPSKHIISTPLKQINTIIPKHIVPKRIISTPPIQNKQIMPSYVRQLRIKFNRNQIKINHLKNVYITQDVDDFKYNSNPNTPTQLTNADSQTSTPNFQDFNVHNTPLHVANNNNINSSLATPDKLLRHYQSMYHPL